MKKSVYEMVTQRIIEQLNKGVIPWHKPWFNVLEGAYNIVSKKPYSLLNQLLLSKEGAYMTFKQAQELGGKIKKGTKSEFVVFWKLQEVEETTETGETVKRTIPLLRYYNVFHISQVEGVKPLETIKAETISDMTIFEDAEQIKEDYKAREDIEIIETNSNKAFYSPTKDYIQVPSKAQYKDITEFYSTLYHELVHSTGHKNRLDRFENNSNIAAFGSADYSKEELIAELGSATLLNILGIENTSSFNNSVAYIQGWLNKLQNDNKFIVSAASKAEKAVKYILNEQ